MVASRGTPASVTLAPVVPSTRRIGGGARAMAPLTLLLHMWSHGGEMWFPIFPGIFNPGFFWIGALLLFVLWKRQGHHGHHRGHGHGHHRPAPNPTTPKPRKGEGGQ